MENPIAEHRKGKGLTQAQLALLLDTSQPYVAQWEAGGVRPTEETIKRLAVVFHIQPEILQKELGEFYERTKKELTEKLRED